MQRLRYRDFIAHPSSLGTFEETWASMMHEADLLADTHLELSKRIGIVAEKPLRKFAEKDSNWNSLRVVCLSLLSCRYS